ncbi:hypothetical protein BB560_000238 [Smittium megazygosporum]|uniref:Uncharacterized protein n=1 Tax=Smittium megazygosporum TaxID=133381 RepID=A0A2T9ZKY3_9FUNG|nr:hypothetical protein BB560_000238 [Smittium megazygosporum]
MSDLIWNHGRKNRTIELDILPDIVDNDCPSHISKKLKLEWDKEVELKRYSLARVLIRVFGKDFIFTGMIGLLWSVFKIIQAYMIGFLVKFLKGSNEPVYKGIIYASVLSISTLFCANAEQHYFFPATRLGYRVRIGLISLLFQKALDTSSSSLVSNGEAINIISNDVQPFESGLHFLNHLWLGPLELILSIAFLWLNIGISSFVAIGCYLLMIPLQTLVSRRFKSIRGKTVFFRDNRIKVISDVLYGIEIVKLTVLELPLIKKIGFLRSLEYKSLKRSNTLKGLNQALFTSSSQIVQFCTFSVLWALVVYGVGKNIGNRGAFEPENIFPCVYIFSFLRLTMTLFFPKACEYLSEMRVSVKRIENFMKQPNHSKLEPVQNDLEFQDKNGFSNNENEFAVVFENASFSWKLGKPKSTHPEKKTNSSGKSKSKNNSSDNVQADDLSPTLTLKNLSLKIKKSKLCTIVGPVGAGNNVEIEIQTSPCSVAYSPQSPWIFGGTVKENILFGKPYDKEWFNTVVAACSLENDFKHFEFGQETEVGERGITLSGGQRARISLARAVYTKAELYLLDDPLSAVDPKVGKWLFDNVICGILKDKTRVIVTHQLQYISKSDQIVVVKGGEIIESGSPKEIDNLERYGIFDQDNSENKENYDLEIKDSCSLYSNCTSSESLNKNNENLSLDSFHTASDVSTESNSSNGARIPSFSSVSSLNLHNYRLSSYDHINSVSVEEIQQQEPNRIKLNSNKRLFRSFKKNKKISKKAREKEISLKIGSKETIESKKTSLKTYISFFRLGGNYAYIAMCMFFVLVMLGLSMSADYFLSKWASSSPEAKADKSKVYIYFILVFGSTMFSITASVLLYRLVLESSNNLLLKMINAVISAPISFFESQPLGRILNRFSKDQSNTDELLPTAAVDTIVTLMQTLGVLIFLCMAIPLLMVAIPFLILIFIWLRQIYIKSSRQIKQIESISRSPVYSILSETLEGLTTVRSFSSQDTFIDRFNAAQKENGIAFFAFIGAARWLAYRLDFVTCILITITSFSCVLARSSVSSGMAALSMSYMLSLIGLVQWCVRQSIEVEITFISVERNIAYSKLKPEESQEHISSTIEPPKEWPESGSVVINGLNLKYPSSNKPVLSDIFMNIIPGQKIGIVGRTGAGKSSFVSSIFRLVEPYPKGCISIDGVNISALRLKKLRSSLSMIPQQPFLFEGTLRFNLDPWNEYSDEDLWKALEAASLKEKVESLPEKLESIVVENGKNFSVGERQLFSLCRAILHKKKLVVMDEATANVDLETDQKIQQSIHTHFKDSTVITIAHRLHTVIGAGYHKIAVFEHGKLVEFGHPHELLMKSDSLLSKMVSNTGPEMEASLRRRAEKEYILRLSKQQ